MAANDSSVYINDEFISLEFIKSLFLCINFLLLTVFFMNDFFYTTMRYIFFALTLMSDCMVLIVANVLFILRYLNCSINMSLCLVLFVTSYFYSFLTPVTLTAMTLERYVAICMPLRHGELCSTRNALHCILIIHSISILPCVIYLSIFFAYARLSYTTQRTLCSEQNYMLFLWQGHIRSAISQFYFLIMCIIIMFSYFKIMKVARAASGQNRKSSWKGVRTVVLHGFQLFLCLFQLWCPFIEESVLQINPMVYIELMYLNYIVFVISPRCLSPLIYGLRDEHFFAALRSFVLCGLYKK